MNDPTANETARQFMGRLLKSVFEAPTGAAGAAELPHIFEHDVRLTINGEEFDWKWLVQHVRESHARLQNVAVDVTHAVREGSLVMDRHVVSATATDTGTRWQIEVLAAYELSAGGKIRRIHEMTRMHAGEYTGW